MQNVPENQIQPWANRSLSARGCCCVGAGMGSGAVLLSKKALSRSSTPRQGRHGHCSEQTTGLCRKAKDARGEMLWEELKYLS